MQGRRSLGLPLENPLHQNPRRSTPPPPLLEEGVLSELFESLSLEEESAAEGSSSRSISSEEEVQQGDHTMAQDQ